jgi:hypothetical protein
MHVPEPLRLCRLRGAGFHWGFLLTMALEDALLILRLLINVVTTYTPQIEGLGFPLKSKTVGRSKMSFKNIGGAF